MYISEFLFQPSTCQLFMSGRRILQGVICMSENLVILQWLYSSLYQWYMYNLVFCKSFTLSLKDCIGLLIVLLIQYLIKMYSHLLLGVLELTGNSSKFLLLSYLNHSPPQEVFEIGNRCAEKHFCQRRCISCTSQSSVSIETVCTACSSKHFERSTIVKLFQFFFILHGRLLLFP